MAIKTFAEPLHGISIHDYSWVRIHSIRCTTFANREIYKMYFPAFSCIFYTLIALAAICTNVFHILHSSQKHLFYFYSNNEKVLKASKGGAKGMVKREKKVRGVGKVEIVGNLKHLHIITFEEAAVKWAKHTRQKRV